MTARSVTKPPLWAWNPAQLAPQWRDSVHFVLPVWDHPKRLSSAPAGRHQYFSRFGNGLTTPGSSMASGGLEGPLQAAGPYLTPGSKVDDRTANNQLTIPKWTDGNNQLEPPATFVFTINDIPALDGQSRYHTVFCVGGSMWWTGGRTPWDIVTYRRSVDTSHRFGIYSRNTSTLAGAAFVPNDYGFALEWGNTKSEAFTIVLAWGKDGNVAAWMNGVFLGSKAASAAWQGAGATGTTAARFFHAPAATATEYDFAGDMYFFAALNRAVSGNEGAQLSVDPWQLIRKDESRLDVGWYQSGGPYVWG